MRRRDQTACGAALLLGLAAAAGGLDPGVASAQDTKALMGRAQSQSEQKAVEDLIRRLSRPGAAAPASAAVPAPGPATPPVGTAAPARVPAPAAAAPTAAPVPPPAAPVAPAPSVPAAPVIAAPVEPGAAPPSAPPAAQVPPAAPAAPAMAAPLPPPSPAPAPAPAARPYFEPLPSIAAPVPPAAPAVPPTKPEPAPSAVASPSAPSRPLPAPATAEPAGTPGPRAADAARTDRLPSVDIEVYFEFGSAVITPRAAETLVPLGMALSDPRLARAAFLIAGHTDAKGGQAYNVRLSQQRAEAVRAFLIRRFGIAPQRLVSRGMGSRQPKNPKDPGALENRRVQIINLSSQVDG